MRSQNDGIISVIFALLDYASTLEKAFDTWISKRGANTALRYSVIKYRKQWPFILEKKERALNKTITKLENSLTLH